MKKLGIILSVLLVAVVLLVVGLQMFLTKGLTTALNQRVFPSVKEMYGLELSVTNASVNLFAGSAELSGLTVRNLTGYKEPYLLTFDKCRLEVEMMSLLKRDPVIVKLAEAKGATLVIEQNKARLFNVKELADALKKTEASKAPTAQKTSTSRQQPPAATAVTAEPMKPIPVHVRRAAVDALVKYVDSKQNKEYDLNLRLTGTDFFTIPAQGQPKSLIVLRGSLVHDKNAFATDLSAILAPLTDPANPSFNIAGSVMDIDAGFLSDLTKKKEMEIRSFSIKPYIICDKGQIKGSRIDLVLNGLKIYGTDIGDTPVKLPLGGTLQQPALDLGGALQSLFSEQAVKIGKAIGMKHLRKELGAGTNASPRDLLLSALTNNVKEVSNSPALQQVIEQVVPGEQSTNAVTTNTPTVEAAANVLIDELGKSAKELEHNEAVKESLKSLGNTLFGK